MTAYLTGKRILQEVADKHGIPKEWITGRGRRQLVIEARRDAYLTMHGAGMRVCDIAFVMDKDHTSVLKAVNTYGRARKER